MARLRLLRFEGRARDGRWRGPCRADEVLLDVACMTGHAGGGKHVVAIIAPVEQGVVVGDHRVRRFRPWGAGTMDCHRLEAFSNLSVWPHSFLDGVREPICKLMLKLGLFASDTSRVNRLVRAERCEGCRTARCRGPAAVTDRSDREPDLVSTPSRSK